MFQQQESDTSTHFEFIRGSISEPNNMFGGVVVMWSSP